MKLCKPGHCSGKNIIFSEPREGPFYYPRSLGWGKFPEHHGHCIQGAMSVGNCWQEGPYVYADIDLYFCDTYDREVR